MYQRSKAIASASLVTIEGLEDRRLLSATIYENTFEYTGPDHVATGITASLNKTAKSTAPQGQKFLGEFGKENVSLSLGNIGAHETVTVSFDLYLIRSWDGTSTYSGYGPDSWGFSIDGASKLSATFSNKFSHYNIPVYQPQSFQSQSSVGGQNDAGTGAVATGALGYSFQSRSNMDAVYHFTYTLDHSSPTLALLFNGSPNQDKNDESWGIDNIKVEAEPVVTIERAEADASGDGPDLREGQSDVAAFVLKRSFGGGLLEVPIRVAAIVQGTAGLAAPVDDYTTSPGITGGNNDDITVSFAAGELETTIYITALADELIEGDETVTASLYDGYGTEGYEIGAASHAQVTIKDTSVLLNSLGVRDLANGENDTFATTPEVAVAYVVEQANGKATIQIGAEYSPNTLAAGEHILFAVDGSGVTGAAGSNNSGSFGGEFPIRTLDPSQEPDRTWVVTAGVDTDLDGLLDSTEVERTIQVHVFRLSFQKTWSDQISGETGNSITAGATKQPAFILMGDSFDELAYAKSDFTILGDAPELRSRLVFGFADIEEAAWTHAPSFSVSGNTVSVWGETVGSGVRDKKIVFGFDSDEDGALSKSEVLGWSPHLFKVVNSDAYQSAISSLGWDMMGGEFLGRVHSVNLLNAFLNHGVPSGASFADDAVSVDGTRLSHKVGADFLGGVAPIMKAVFLSTSAIAADVIASDAMTKLVNAAIQLHKVEMRDAMLASDLDADMSVEFGPFNLATDIKFLGEQLGFDIDADLATAIGKGALDAEIYVTAGYMQDLMGEVPYVFGWGDHVIEPDVPSGATVDFRIAVSSVRVRGVVKDLYDFEYTSGTNAASRAATVQAGYGTLGSAGHVYTTEIVLDGDKTGFRTLGLGERQFTRA